MRLSTMFSWDSAIAESVSLPTANGNLLGGSRYAPTMNGGQKRPLTVETKRHHSSPLVAALPVRRGRLGHSAVADETPVWRSCQSRLYQTAKGFQVAAVGSRE